jgi:hypothetical protein
MDLLDAFNAADDITIAYPTQTINVARNTQVDSEQLIPHINGTNSLFNNDTEN